MYPYITVRGYFQYMDVMTGKCFLHYSPQYIMDFLHKGPVIQSFILFYISLNKLLIKQLLVIPDTLTLIWHHYNDFRRPVTLGVVYNKLDMCIVGVVHFVPSFSGDNLCPCFKYNYVLSLQIIYALSSNKIMYNSVTPPHPPPYSLHYYCLLYTEYIDGLMQDCIKSSALAMELLQSCTKPLIYCGIHISYIFFTLRFEG